MATFVLIHGAWHGGWCWKKVTPRLRAAGHAVYTPTLTGLGERAHLLSPAVDLTCHVQDIVNVLEYEDLQQVVLVGHSYAGMVITGVADRVPERVAHLVYFDASVPRDGESMLDMRTPENRAEREERVRARGDGWKLPIDESLFEQWQISDPNDVAWLRARLTPHPFKTWQEPLTFSAAKIAQIPRTFIFCTEPRGKTLGVGVRRVLEQPGWRYRELPTAHDAMVTLPAGLTDLFLEVAPDASSH